MLERLLRVFQGGRRGGPEKNMDEPDYDLEALVHNERRRGTPFRAEPLDKVPEKKEGVISSNDLIWSDKDKRWLLKKPKE